MSEENTKYRVSGKTFLDTSETGEDEYGTISYYVHVREGEGYGQRDKKNPKMSARLDGNVRISDCSRHINLELYSSNTAEVQDRIDKLLTLRAMVNRAINSLSEAHTLMQEIESKDNPDYEP